MSYSVEHFLEDCYSVAGQQKAYKLKDEEQAKACIQAFRYVLREAFNKYGESEIIKIITSKHQESAWENKDFKGKGTKKIDTRITE